jgi:redox-sensing transcriptional repressor
MKGNRSNHQRAVAAAKEAISELTTERLSVYLRCLTHLESLNQQTVSSHELARLFHLNSAQIRKDLAYFGEFGIRGVGYDVKLLKEHLIATLGIGRARVIVIAGAGNLGMALADYRGLNSTGFRIAAMLDNDPRKIGHTSRSGVPVYAIEDLPAIVGQHHVEIGIIAVPPPAAQEVYNRMADAGLCAILNFAPIQLSVRDRIKLKSVDVRISLESLSFYLKNVEDGLCPPG